MPRRSKGPRLELQTGEGRSPKWIIRDGKRNISTRCDESNREQAEAKLAEYILSKHDASKAIRSGSPKETKDAGKFPKSRPPSNGRVAWFEDEVKSWQKALDETV
jgi:hypothetical protein